MNKIEILEELEKFIKENYIWEEEENYKIINLDILLNFIEELKNK